MYRKCFPIVLRTKTLISATKPVILKTHHADIQLKRWAGHSKWQNIKSIKELKDQEKGNKFSKLARLITLAVRKGGEDPSRNSELKNLIEEAQKSNMPKASIQKALTATTGQGKPYWVVLSGPKGICLGLEVTFANTNSAFLWSKLSKAKKFNFKLESHIDKVCSEKGIIITDFLENCENSYEKALEDGIEIGVIEVHETDDKTLIFECLPERLDSQCQQLAKRGYNIVSATTELEFNNMVNLNDDEVQAIEKCINSLKEYNEEIVRTCYNTSIQ